MIDFTKKYPNLPGMLVEYKDGGMALKANNATVRTDSMLILGTAVDGPVMDPVAVDDDSAFLLFGDETGGLGSGNSGTLLKGYVQARELGCTDIRLMRVTGNVSNSRINGSEKELSEVKRIEEVFATVSGNDKTTITLSNDNIEVSSLKVYIKGKLLNSGYTLNQKELVIEAGVGDAGAGVTVQYAYVKPVKVLDEIQTVSLQKTVTLDATPKSGTLLITKDSQEVVSSNYSVAGNVITFTTGVEPGDILEIDYDKEGGETILVTESGTPEDPFVTATSSISKVLKEKPIAKSIKLYVDGVLFTNDKVLDIEDADGSGQAEVLHGGNFEDADEDETIHGGNFKLKGVIRIDVARKKVSVGKEHFPRGAKLTIEYLTEKVTTVNPSIDIESYFGGSIYNQGSVSVQDIVSTDDNVIGKKVVITKPEFKSGSSKVIEYSSIDYATFGEMVQAINDDSKNGVYKATTQYEEELTVNLIKSSSYFVGGEDGLNPTPQEMFEALTGTRDDEGLILKSGAFQLLEGYQVDTIVPYKVYADQVLIGKFNNFAYELGLLCAVLTHRNKATVGCISVTPNKDVSLRGVQEYADKLANLNNLYFLRDQNGNIIKDSNGDAMDLGKYLSVVAGPEVEYTDSKIGRFWGDPAVDYAARNCTLSPQSAPTNKKLNGAKRLRFNFSNYQLDKITGNRIVTFKNRLNGNSNDIVIVDGVTAAHPNSDYTRITTTRVMRYTTDQIREAAEPFLGESNTIEQKNALASAISKRLSICKENGVIIDYAFQIIQDARSQLLGEANIELTLVPPQELRKITAVMGLKASL